LAGINQEEGISDSFCFNNRSHAYESPDKHEKYEGEEIVEINPKEESEAKNTSIFDVNSTDKKNFSLAKLKLNKLSNPNSPKNDGKMVEFMRKKKSNAEGVAVDTQMKQYMQKAKKEKEKLDHYLKNSSQMNS
jgi:hypothetical protein